MQKDKRRSRIIGWIVVAILVNIIGYGITGIIPYSPIVLLFGNAIGTLASFAVEAGIIYLLFLGMQSSLTRLIPFQEDIKELRQRVKDEPEKVEPLWELGRVKLELYFNRNLSQINYIFWLSVTVMIV